MNIGYALRNERKKIGLTREFVCSKAGIGTVTLSRIENSYYPSKSAFEKLCRLYEINPNDLIKKALYL